MRNERGARAGLHPLAALQKPLALGRRPLETGNAKKVGAIRQRLAKGQGVRRIAFDLRCGVGTVLRIRDGQMRRPEAA